MNEEIEDFTESLEFLTQMPIGDIDLSSLEASSPPALTDLDLESLGAQSLPAAAQDPAANNSLWNPLANVTNHPYSDVPPRADDPSIETAKQDARCSEFRGIQKVLWEQYHKLSLLLGPPCMEAYPDKELEELRTFAHSLQTFAERPVPQWPRPQTIGSSSLSHQMAATSSIDMHCEARQGRGDCDASGAAAHTSVSQRKSVRRHLSAASLTGVSPSATVADIAAAAAAAAASSSAASGRPHTLRRSAATTASWKPTAITGSDMFENSAKTPPMAIAALATSGRLASGPLGMSVASPLSPATAAADTSARPVAKAAKLDFIEQYAITAGDGTSLAILHSSPSSVFMRTEGEQTVVYVVRENNLELIITSSLNIETVIIEWRNTRLECQRQSIGNHKLQFSHDGWKQSEKNHQVPKAKTSETATIFVIASHPHGGRIEHSFDCKVVSRSLKSRILGERRGRPS